MSIILEILIAILATHPVLFTLSISLRIFKKVREDKNMGPLTAKNWAVILIGPVIWTGYIYLVAHIIYSCAQFIYSILQ